MREKNEVNKSIHREARTRNIVAVFKSSIPVDS